MCPVHAIIQIFGSLSFIIHASLPIYFPIYLSLYLPISLILVLHSPISVTVAKEFKELSHSTSRLLNNVPGHDGSGEMASSLSSHLSSLLPWLPRRSADVPRKTVSREKTFFQEAVSFIFFFFLRT